MKLPIAIPTEVSEIDKLISDAVPESIHLDYKRSAAVDERCIQRITSLNGPTGLNLSVSSIRNLRHVLSGDQQFEKLNPTGLDYDVFMEVLGVDFETAYQLSDFFYRGNECAGLNAIEGITQETIENVKEHFILQDSIVPQT